MVWYGASALRLSFQPSADAQAIFGQETVYYTSILLDIQRIMCILLLTKSCTIHFLKL